MMRLDGNLRVGDKIFQFIDNQMVEAVVIHIENGFCISKINELDHVFYGKSYVSRLN